jgi:hypothetical protein
MQGRGIAVPTILDRRKISWRGHAGRPDATRRPFRALFFPALNKPASARTPTFVRIDVGKDQLEVCCFDAEGRCRTRRFISALCGYANAQLRRTKTGAVDAEVIADFARRMPFTLWEPPEEEVANLQAIPRRIQALTVEHTRERNRSCPITDSA